jgi:hypothetical protein
MPLSPDGNRTADEVDAFAGGKSLWIAEDWGNPSDDRDSSDFAVVEETITDCPAWLEEMKSFRPTYVRCGRTDLRVMVPRRGLRLVAPQRKTRIRQRAPRPSVGRARGSRRGQSRSAGGGSSGDDPDEGEPPGGRRNLDVGPRVPDRRGVVGGGAAPSIDRVARSRS